MRYQEIFFLSLFLLVFSSNTLFAQKDSISSFAKQGKNARYYSFSFGMGIDFSDNKSLKTYIEYELPAYNQVPENQKLSTYKTGIEFFGGLELQVAKKFAIKGEYSYHIKSCNSSYTDGYWNYANYDFTYNIHQPYITLYYLIPQKNSFIKIGTGIGYLISTFTARGLYNVVGRYTSNGIGIKLDAVLNIQMTKRLSGFLGVYMNKTFQQDLKNSDGTLLLNKNNESVNLNSFGVGLKLGMEFFYFKI